MLSRSKQKEHIMKYRLIVIYSTFLLLISGVLSITKAQKSDSTGIKSVIQDTLFQEPYIDVDEWRTEPTRHRYIHGGFRGTTTRFSFYFPPDDKYEGRFYQYITPVPDSETLSQGAEGEEDKISFSIASGAYFIETNGGGRNASGPTGTSSIGAYRANAASAEYSRIVAEKIYGEHRTYGYAFGGSGGAYRTIGGFENTEGVWDGVVPYVIGSPMAIPNVFTARMHAMRVLQDKFPQIVDAVEPGGSGSMYEGLNVEERRALKEVTRMGFPPEAWFAYETMGIHAFSAIYEGMLMADPSYFKDFWNTPGYLGANPPESLLEERIQQTSTIEKFISVAEAQKRELDVGTMPGQARGTADAAWQSLSEQKKGSPVAFELADTLKDVQFLGGDLYIKSGKAGDNRLFLRQIKNNVAVFGSADSSVLADIAPGDTVIVDNSNFLAAQTYHRHQVPAKDKEYKVWDQFRGFDGTPIYPQRPMILGPLFTRSTAGSIPSGVFEGKMIVLSSLWDREAFPWQADWYRSEVEKHFGEKANEHFRLWYTDHALHGDFSKQEYPTRTVSYLGVLQQALRDLSSWVEEGIAPPASTNYTIKKGQVIIPPTAENRRGIQPVIDVTANGGERAEISAGESVTFKAVIEVPPEAGQVTAAEWDFEGSGDFPVKEQITDAKSEKSGRRVILRQTHTFTKPGTYFPALRGISRRNPNDDSPFARIQNLGRVRVVVK